jgi:Ca-activated chloride channel family protein
MKFLRIDMLFLIWVVPVLALAYFYGGRKRNRILKRFARERTRKLLVPPGLENRRRWRASLVLLSMLFLVAALAGPLYGFKWQKVEQRGIDMIIALDCSRSMLATDIQPTRLDRAKREIYDLLAMLEGDRIGLAAFSGTAFLQCPLTLDYHAFYLFLDVLTPDYLPVGGTDLAAAVRTAVDGFDPQSSAEKAIILITDGENTGPEDPLEAVREAKDKGVTVFCIGVGSEQGVPIPAAEGGFTKDDGGQIVLSRLDETLLSRMATTTGGTYVRSVAGDMDLDTIYRDHIRANLEQTLVEGGRKQVWANRFQWPLALAVLLLMVAQWIPAAKGTRLTSIILLLTMIPPVAAEAGPAREGYKAYQQGQYDQALKQFIDGQLKDPDNPELLYNIGNAYYKNGDFAAAADHYRQSLQAANPGLKPKLLYNLGNSAYRQGKLQEAVENYQAALDLTPEDIQTRENLDFVKKQLEQQQQQQQQQSGQDQSQNQDNQNQPSSGNGNQSGDQQQNPSQASQGQQQEGQSPPPQSGSQADDQKEEQGGQQEQREGQQKEQQAPSAADQALRRLKDEPGRALMPNYRKRRVEKDW